MKKVVVGGFLVAAIVVGQAKVSSAQPKVGSRFTGGLKLTTWSPLDASRSKPAKKKNFDVTVESEKGGRIFIVERQRKLRLGALPEFSDGSLEASGTFIDEKDGCHKTVTYRVGAVRGRRAPFVVTTIGDCQNTAKGYQAGYLEKYSGSLNREKRARR